MFPAFRVPPACGPLVVTPHPPPSSALTMQARISDPVSTLTPCRPAGRRSARARLGRLALPTGLNERSHGHRAAWGQTRSDHPGQHLNTSTGWRDGGDGSQSNGMASPTGQPFRLRRPPPPAPRSRLARGTDHCRVPYGQNLAFCTGCLPRSTGTARGGCVAPIVQRQET